ncbi:MAG: hypothetical protein NC818_05395 [Candidatus Omnitrophica bacterium]|nr:hypothetical protein [Candidatus Omnitrophota bacterium]
MLSEAEKKELLSLAKAKHLQEEFRKMAKKNFPSRGKNIDLDCYIKFLDSFNRIFNFNTTSQKSRSFSRFKNCKKFIL